MFILWSSFLQSVPAGRFQNWLRHCYMVGIICPAGWNRLKVDTKDVWDESQPSPYDPRGLSLCTFFASKWFQAPENWEEATCALAKSIYKFCWKAENWSGFRYENKNDVEKIIKSWSWICSLNVNNCRCM